MRAYIDPGERELVSDLLSFVQQYAMLLVAQFVRAEQATEIAELKPP